MGLLELFMRLLGQKSGGRDLPPAQQGHDTAELARRLGMTEAQLRGIDAQYHMFSIAKRRGGTRTIMAPAPALKSVQQRIHRRLLKRLRAHPAAMGFAPGQSIASHALCHAGQAVVVRMDLRDFFPSTTSRRMHRYFRWIGWNQQAAELLVRLTTWDGALPQGAPTSPRLSNLVNYRMDLRLAAMAKAVGRGAAADANAMTPTLEIFYSRYADDLSFSFSRDDHHAIEAVIRWTGRIVEAEGYKLHTKKKLRIMRRHDRQVVTGLVVNEGVRLPRHRRRWLRAVEHRMRVGRPATVTPEQLAGWRALRHMVESVGEPST